MQRKTSGAIYTARCSDGANLRDVELQEHPSSRAMRLVDDPTRFLLVSVGKKAEDRVLRVTLLRWMREGVEINRVRYRFLGFTESQVKAGKLMFFREDHEWTVRRLLSSFGDLDAVYIQSGYGKYSARLGLSFSSTLESFATLTDAAVFVIPDLKAPDGSLYSDGCGMIRHSFAQRLCVHHDFPQDTTVFQIRRGGIKGILVRYPDDKFEQLCGPRSRECLVAYRPSMHKYGGGPSSLEINNCNLPPAPARLNVQFIALLLSLGIPLDVFQRLLQDQLDVIKCILTDREKALQYIKGELDAGIEDDLYQSLYAMLLAQHDLSEPLVRHRLQQFQKSQFDSLRRKLLLRVVDSCYLFGVMDEDGVLGPNEVYVNLPNRSGVLVRDVVVARNPSYHPGDIRRLRAVDNPVLRHHRNCIVFPRTSLRSIPDSIASGDLDGDKYFVCWEPTLIPPTEMQPLDRVSSMSAGCPASQATGRPRQLSDMPRDAVNTFMHLKFNRLLGQMANEWTRQIELTPDLANGELPRKLVPLIESALDLMKTGEDFARLETAFKELQPRIPNHSQDGFSSPLQILRAMIPNADVSAPRVLDCDPALVLMYEDVHLWNEYISEARTVMPRYNKELSDAIELDREKNTPEFAPAVHHDPYEREPCQADRVKRDYQSRYFGGGERREYERQRIRASAWYWYGYSKNKGSFAWLGDRYLNEIKALWSNGNRPIMYVGARNHRPCQHTSTATVARTDSEATLVGVPAPPSDHRVNDDTMAIDTDCEDDTPLQKSIATSTTCAGRRSGRQDEMHEDAATRPRARRCTQEQETVARVSVLTHPRPKAPVTTPDDLPCALHSSTGHQWRVTTSNGSSRRYMCSCGYEVHEKKNNGYWVPVSVSICEPRGGRMSNETPDWSPNLPGPRTRSQARGTQSSHPTTSAASSPLPVDPSDEGGHSGDLEIDGDDAMSVYESAVEDETPRRSSTGTTTSEALSPLGGVPHLPRLPGRPGSDVSSPIGRSRQVPPRGVQRRAAGTPAASSAATPAAETHSNRRVLVSENPKPSYPVVTRVPPCRSAPDHSWKLWGNSKMRRYTCERCSFIAKEHKDGSPEVWVPAT